MSEEPPLCIKITVATVTYNAAALIERTIASVEKQDYPYVEHLIIDGNSQDATLQCVHHYQERNSVASVQHEVNCLSEPDTGLYDAMNKAIDMATGHYIVFLNAGDTFHSNDTLRRVAACVAQRVTKDAAEIEDLPAVLYGDTHLVDEKGNFIRRRRLSPPEVLKWKSFRHGMLVCHQAFYARTDLAKNNLYNLNYRFSADFDWCVRIMREAEQKHAVLLNTHTVVADYLNEGMTTRNHKASLNERFRIMAKHYGWVSTALFHAWFVVRGLIQR